MNDEIVKNVTDKLDLALERGKQLIEDEHVQERIQDLKNVAEETVRKHPIKVL